MSTVDLSRPRSTSKNEMMQRRYTCRDLEVVAAHGTDIMRHNLLDITMTRTTSIVHTIFVHRLQPLSRPSTADERRKRAANSCHSGQDDAEDAEDASVVLSAGHLSVRHCSMTTTCPHPSSSGVTRHAGDHRQSAPACSRQISALVTWPGADPEFRVEATLRLRIRSIPGPGV